MHARKPAPGLVTERLGQVAALLRQSHEDRKAGIEDPVHRPTAQRLVIALAEELERGAIRSLDETLIVERQYPFTGCTDELGAVVKPHQVKVLAGAEQGAVLYVLGGHIDQREGVALEIRRGPGDIERREQLPAHVKDRGRGACQLRVLREEMIRAVNHHGMPRSQTGPHAIGTHLPLAPHDALTQTAAPGGCREARIPEAVEDDAVPVGEHDAVLGMPDQLAQRLHLDARNVEQHAEALATRPQVGVCDAVRAPSFVRIERVAVDTAAPGAADDLADREIRTVPSDQAADEVGRAVGRRSWTYHD